MKITIITPWYNEIAFAPFFLNLYSYVDKILILLDKDTDDGTRKICKQYDNVEIEEISYPEGFSAYIPIAKANEIVPEMESDWVYYLDPDEFIFPADGESARTVLERQESANVLYAKMWQTWRHKTETDLDYSKPSVYQRRHGTPFYKRRTYLWDKPCIVKPEAGAVWYSGHHSLNKHKSKNIIISKEKFVGAHWKCADVDVAIKKRIEKHHRMRPKNGYGLSSIESIKEGITKACNAHLNDSQMF